MHSPSNITVATTPAFGFQSIENSNDAAELDATAEHKMRIVVKQKPAPLQDQRVRSRDESMALSGEEIPRVEPMSHTSSDPFVAGACRKHSRGKGHPTKEQQNARTSVSSFLKMLRPATQLEINTEALGHLGLFQLYELWCLEFRQFTDIVGSQQFANMVHLEAPVTDHWKPLVLQQYKKMYLVWQLPARLLCKEPRPHPWQILNGIGVLQAVERGHLDSSDYPKFGLQDPKDHVVGYVAPQPARRSDAKAGTSHSSAPAVDRNSSSSKKQPPSPPKRQERARSRSRSRQRQGSNKFQRGTRRSRSRSRKRAPRSRSPRRVPQHRDMRPPQQRGSVQPQSAKSAAPHRAHQRQGQEVNRRRPVVRTRDEIAEDNALVTTTLSQQELAAAVASIQDAVKRQLSAQHMPVLVRFYMQSAATSEQKQKRAQFLTALDLQPNSDSNTVDMQLDDANAEWVSRLLAVIKDLRMPVRIRVKSNDVELKLVQELLSDQNALVKLPQTIAASLQKDLLPRDHSAVPVAQQSVSDERPDRQLEQQTADSENGRSPMQEENDWTQEDDGDSHWKRNSHRDSEIDSVSADRNSSFGSRESVDLYASRSHNVHDSGFSQPVLTFCIQHEGDEVPVLLEKHTSNGISITRTLNLSEYCSVACLRAVEGVPDSVHLRVGERPLGSNETLLSLGDSPTVRVVTEHKVNATRHGGLGGGTKACVDCGFSGKNGGEIKAHVLKEHKEWRQWSDEQAEARGLHICRKCKPLKLFVLNKQTKHVNQSHSSAKDDGKDGSSESEDEPTRNARKSDASVADYELTTGQDGKERAERLQDRKASHMHAAHLNLRSRSQSPPAEDATQPAGDSSESTELGDQPAQEANSSPRPTPKKCASCSGDFKPDNSVVTLECGHGLHKSCLSTANYECFGCKAPISEAIYREADVKDVLANRRHASATPEKKSEGKESKRSGSPQARSDSRSGGHQQGSPSSHTQPNDETRLETQDECDDKHTARAELPGGLTETERKAAWKHAREEANASPTPREDVNGDEQLSPESVPASPAADPPASQRHVLIPASPAPPEPDNRRIAQPVFEAVESIPASPAARLATPASPAKEADHPRPTQENKVAPAPAPRSGRVVIDLGRGELPEVATIANHAPLHTEIHSEVKPRWVEINQPLWEAYYKASMRGSDKEREVALAAILTLPMRALIRPRGGTGGRQLRSMREALRRVDQQIKALDPRLELPQAKGNGPPKPNDERAQAKRAQSLMARGYISKAARALEQKGLLDTADPKVMQKLKDLHPQGDSKLPDCPSDAPRPVVQPNDDFIEFLKQYPCGASPGLDGWTASMIKPLIGNKICTRGIAALLGDILSGKLKRMWALDILRSAHLIAVPKDEKGGVRPITMGALFVKMATSYGYKTVAADLRALLGPDEFSYGAKAGAERLIHLANALSLDEEKGLAMLEDDKISAFQRISRKRMLEVAYHVADLAPIWRLLDFLYSTPSKLWTYTKKGRLEHTLSSSEGVRQGGVESMPQFCLTVVEHYNTTRRMHPAIKILSFADNMHIIGPPGEVMKAAETLERENERDGLMTNRSKRQLVCFHNNRLPERELKAFEEANPGLRVETKAAIVMGAVVGKDQDASADMITKMAEADREWFRKVQLLHPQFAMVLLRQAGIPRGVWMVRTTNPEHNLDACRLRDDMVMEAAKNIALPGFGDEALDPLERWFQLPAPMSGLGLRAMKDIRYIAFYASLAAAAKDLTRHGCTGFKLLKAQVLELDKRVRPLLPTPEEEKKAKEAREAAAKRAKLDRAQKEKQAEPPLDEVKEKKSRENDGKDEKSAEALEKEAMIRRLLPVRAHEMMAYYSGDGAAFAIKLQKNLTELAEQRRLRQMKKGLSVQESARVNSLLGKWASRAFTLNPTEADLRLSAIQYHTAMAFRYGVPLPGIAEAKMAECPCGANLKEDPFHWLNCPKTRRRQQTVRHDQEAVRLAVAYQQAGASVEREPRVDKWEDNKHPDLRVTVVNQSKMIDVSIINATAPSHVKIAARGPLAAAYKREQEKMKKYETLARENGCQFVPFVLEAHGAFGKRAQEVVKDVASTALKYGLLMEDEAKQLKKTLVDRIAVTLQRHNATTLMQGQQITAHACAQRR
jgi:hypothetical protein